MNINVPKVSKSPFSFSIMVKLRHSTPTYNMIPPIEHTNFGNSENLNLEHNFDQSLEMRYTVLYHESGQNQEDQTYKQELRGGSTRWTITANSPPPPTHPLSPRPAHVPYVQAYRCASLAAEVPQAYEDGLTMPANNVLV